MAYLVSMGLAMLVMLVALIVGRFLRKSSDGDARSVGRILQIGSPVLFVIWVGAHSVAASVNQIPAGQVGVVYEFGAIRGQVTEGLQWITPWRSVHLANVQVERHVFERLDSFSQETQDVYVTATLNIRVSPQTIQELYRSVGPNYFDVLVKSRVAQNFKDETVKYKSVDIAPNREGIRRQVRERLERELSPYSIEVVDLLLDNVDFPVGFKTAIEAKQIATQRALEEEQKVSVVRHQAEQAVEKARGEGSAILAVAERQAEANRKLSESLTPVLVQYAMVQKLSDKIQVMILPSGPSLLVNASDMLKESAPKEKDKK